MTGVTPDIFFEDLVPGTVTTFGRHLVDRDAMVAFAREYDAQPFHTDEAAAQASAVGELIASGWYTCALQMRMLCDAWLNRSASRGGPGVDELRWLRPVRAGDTLSVRQTVLEARTSKNRPAIGLVRFRLETLAASGDPVMSQLHTGMFGRRDAPEAAETGFGSGAVAILPSAQKGGPSGPGRDARFFDEVEIGTVTPLGSYAFNAENVLDFGCRYDSQPFHVDEAAAAASPYGRLAASGWHTAAAWMKCFIRHRTGVIERAGAEGAGPLFGVSPGFRDLKWLKPVYPDDVIRFDTEMIDKRLSASRPGWGLVFSRNSGWNAAGERVFEFTGSGFWGLRDG